MNNNSYFDGGVFEDVLYQIGIVIVGVFTFGIAVPFVTCAYVKWQISHTVVSGKRLYFTGTGGDLFVKSLIWVLLTIVTLGIYGFWVNVKFLQWKSEHTFFIEENEKDLIL